MGYQLQWKDYRRRRNFNFLSIAIFFLFFAFAFSTGIKPKEIIEHPFIFTFQFIVLLAVIVSSFRYLSWKCPRCNKKYAGPWYSRKLYSNKCRNCGLVKWTTEDIESRPGL
jgi:hypothetical protein